MNHKSEQFYKIEILHYGATERQQQENVRWCNRPANLKETQLQQASVCTSLVTECNEDIKQETQSFKDTTFLKLITHPIALLLRKQKW